MSTTDKPKSWRDVIKVHPAADLFPMMSPDQLKALGEDINANGLAHPIVLWTPDSNYRKWRKLKKRGEFHLLDGRNRVAALESLDCISFDDDGWPVITCPLGSLLAASDAVIPIILGPEVDPYHYVLSANIHRRHLTTQQRLELLDKVTKANPSISSRRVAKLVGVSPTTAAKSRRKLEERGDVSTVDTSTDTKGRKQPTHKARHTADDFSANRNAQATAVAVRAEEHSRQIQHVVEHVQASAQPVSIPKQLDIEHVLPDADRLVLEILERDQIAPGYAAAVMTGIAARLEVSDYPDILRREQTIAPDART